MLPWSGIHSVMVLTTLSHLSPSEYRVVPDVIIIGIPEEFHSIVREWEEGGGCSKNDISPKIKRTYSKGK